MNTPTTDSAQNIQSLIGANMPSIYVEGITQMLIGFPNSRLMFHNLSQKNPTHSEAPEIRTMACELIIPTAALIEMARGILSTMAVNKETLELAKNEWVSSVSKLTSSL